MNSRQAVTNKHDGKRRQQLHVWIVGRQKTFDEGNTQTWAIHVENAFAEQFNEAIVEVRPLDEALELGFQNVLDDDGVTGEDARAWEAWGRETGGVGEEVASSPS